MRGLQACRTSPSFVLLGFVYASLRARRVCRMSPSFVLVGFDERSTGSSYVSSLRALRVCRMSPPFVLVGFVVCPLSSRLLPQTEGRTKSVGPD